MAEVIPNATPPVLYSEFRNQIAELRAHNASLVFDYEDPKGNQAARSHVYKLRQTRSGLEKARKSAKAAALEYGRNVDAQAKEIDAELEAMIDVHLKPLQAIEAREEERRRKHEDRIERIRELAAPTNEKVSAEKLRDRLAEVESYRMGEHWEEYEVEAGRVRDDAIATLRDWIERQEAAEAAEAELARLRKEKAEQERKEREERIAKEAAERAERAAREREAEATRRHEAELERVRREAAEAAEAEKRAKEREAQAARDREAARERNTRIRNRVHHVAISALVTHAGLDSEVATKAVQAIADGKVPGVSVSYS